ncbi:hypothetical protein B9479_003129 [Cryptococcus floricola]|uniref:Uncharacterized protein n=1 Tax=Cryptococcus floricola TaxID=2591691 RepID=A0A5D3B1K0_9TREE|nr:hypothetical protein B9479_003129 [Cryptococcus floricola]
MPPNISNLPRDIAENIAILIWPDHKALRILISLSPVFYLELLPKLYSVSLVRITSLNIRRDLDGFDIPSQDVPPSLRRSWRLREDEASGVDGQETAFWNNKYFSTALVKQLVIEGQSAMVELGTVLGGDLRDLHGFDTPSEDVPPSLRRSWRLRDDDASGIDDRETAFWNPKYFSTALVEQLVIEGQSAMVELGTVLGGDLTLVLDGDALKIPPSDDLPLPLETGLLEHLFKFSLAVPLAHVAPYNTTPANSILQVVMGAILNSEKVVLHNFAFDLRIRLPTKCDALILHLREDCLWHTDAPDDAMSLIEREIGEENDDLKDQVIHFVEFGAIFDIAGGARRHHWKRRLGKCGFTGTVYLHVVLRNFASDLPIRLPTKCDALILRLREDCPWHTDADDEAMSLMNARSAKSKNDDLKDQVIHFVEFGATFDIAGGARRHNWKRRLGKCGFKGTVYLHEKKFHRGRRRLALFAVRDGSHHHLHDAIYRGGIVGRNMFER